MTNPSPLQLWEYNQHSTPGVGQLLRVNFSDMADGTGAGPGAKISGWECERAGREIRAYVDALPPNTPIGLGFHHFGRQWGDPTYAQHKVLVEGLARGGMLVDSEENRPDGFPNHLAQIHALRVGLKGMRVNMIFFEANPEGGPGTDNLGGELCVQIMTDPRFRTLLPQRVANMTKDEIRDPWVNRERWLEWRKWFNRRVDLTYRRAWRYLVDELKLGSAQPIIAAVGSKNPTTGKLYDGNSMPITQVSTVDSWSTTCQYIANGRWGVRQPILNATEALIRTRDTFTAHVLHTEQTSVSEAAMIVRFARDLRHTDLILWREKN